MSDSSPSPALPLRGWHRPVQRRQLVLAYLLVVVCWAAGLFEVYQILRARGLAVIHIHQQAVQLRLYKGLTSQAQASTSVRSHLHAAPWVDVRVDQDLPIHIQEALQTQLSVRGQIPIDTVFHFDAQVPVSTTIHTQVRLASWLPQFPVSLPLSVTVPVRLNVPIHLSYPLDLQTLVRAHLPATMLVPVRTNLRLRVPIDSDIEAQLLSQNAFSWAGSSEPLAVMVDEARLHLPLGKVGWRIHHASASP